MMMCEFKYLRVMAMKGWLQILQRSRIVASPLDTVWCYTQHTLLFRGRASLHGIRQDRIYFVSIIIIIIIIADSADFPDSLLPFVPIIHRSRQNVAFCPSLFCILSINDVAKSKTSNFLVFYTSAGYFVEASRRKRRLTWRGISSRPAEEIEMSREQKTSRRKKRKSGGRHKNSFR